MIRIFLIIIKIYYLETYMTGIIWTKLSKEQFNLRSIIIFISIISDLEKININIYNLSRKINKIFRTIIIKMII